jgi:hypothetical protein
MWITKEMAKAKDKSVNNHGDKRCFTVTSGSSSEGEIALPNFGLKKSPYKISMNALLPPRASPAADASIFFKPRVVLCV